jgi:hypothetical protein
MMTGAFKLLFRYNHYAIGVNARDLSEEESLIQPRPGGNCANWVLGHIVATRGALLRLVGEEPVWSDAESAPYARGSSPIASRDGARPFAEILAAFDRSQERLMAGLERITVQDLGPADKNDSPLAKLAGLQFHEAYHAGQLGILRRIAGKDGAIR